MTTFVYCLEYTTSGLSSVQLTIYIASSDALLGFRLLPPLVLEIAPELPGVIAAHVTPSPKQGWGSGQRPA